jgi:hypothetical protein
MNDQDLFLNINSLPQDLKQEVMDFINFLKNKKNKKKAIKERKFGYAKDFFKMTPDFDAPLEDFKEYMQ